MSEMHAFTLPRPTGEANLPGGGPFRTRGQSVNPWMRQVNSLPPRQPGLGAHISDPRFVDWLHQQLGAGPQSPHIVNEAPVGAHPALASPAAAPSAAAGPVGLTPVLPDAGTVAGTSVMPGAQNEAGTGQEFPTQYKLAQNPLLTQSPATAYTDSEYLSADALLRKQTSDAYARILSQLGFTDPSGKFVPGSVWEDYQRNSADLNRSIGLADESTTQDAQRAGTLFSGIRGTLQARAEYPYVHSLADLNVETPRTLADLYNQATGLVSDFTLQQNQLLAQAAARQAAELAANPPASGIPNKPQEAGAVGDYLSGFGVSPDLFTGFAPNPPPPTFSPAAAEQNPYDPNLVGPGSQSLVNPSGLTMPTRRRRPNLPLYGGQQTHGI